MGSFQDFVLLNFAIKGGRMNFCMKRGLIQIFRESFQKVLHIFLFEQFLGLIKRIFHEIIFLFGLKNGDVFNHILIDNGLPAMKGYNPFDNILQFPNITWPVMVHKDLQSFGMNFLFMLIHR